MAGQIGWCSQRICEERVEHDAVEGVRTGRGAASSLSSPNQPP